MLLGVSAIDTVAIIRLDAYVEVSLTWIAN